MNARDAFREAAEKAQQAMQMAAEDIRELHAAAGHVDPLWEKVTLTMVGDAHRISDQLVGLVAGLRGGA